MTIEFRFDGISLNGEDSDFFSVIFYLINWLRERKEGTTVTIYSTRIEIR